MKVDNTDENFKKCICTGCPTYNECMADKDVKLFCARGKIECNQGQKGCLCGECPVASQYGLKRLYYCQNGPQE